MNSNSAVFHTRGSKWIVVTANTSKSETRLCLFFGTQLDVFVSETALCTVFLWKLLPGDLCLRQIPFDNVRIKDLDFMDCQFCRFPSKNHFIFMIYCTTKSKCSLSGNPPDFFVCASISKQKVTLPRHTALRIVSQSHVWQRAEQKRPLGATANKTFEGVGSFFWRQNTWEFWRKNSNPHFPPDGPKEPIVKKVDLAMGAPLEKKPKIKRNGFLTGLFFPPRFFFCGVDCYPPLITFLYNFENISYESWRSGSFIKRQSVSGGTFRWPPNPLHASFE